MEPEEEAVVLKVRNRDEQALADFIVLKRPQLLAFIDRRLGAALRRKIEADDLFQETSAEAVRSLSDVDLADRDPFNWLCQVAERRIIDAHRRFFGSQKRDAGREVSLNAGGGSTSDTSRPGLINLLVASMTSASQAFSRDQRQMKLLAALEKLPEDHREALRLRYLENLPSKDIAEKLGKSDGAVRVMLTRSLAKLQQILELEGTLQGNSVARIVMAMSGGVDSSVAAALLCRAGHEVIGVFMRHGEHDPVAAATACASNTTGATNSATLPIVSGRLDHKQGCCSASDAEDARRVAQLLDVPFYALNLSEDFARIIDYFVDEYSAARTPNPCVMCNNWLKFGKLFDYADSVGAEFVATGHYARIENSAFSRVAYDALLRGLDGTKDQSYVLFGVARHYLPRMMLPIGGYRKTQIRQLAHELGLRVADKPDSQEICFVTSGDHADFVRRRRGDSNDLSGDIVLADGEIVGHHEGIEAFTIGQRKGIGVALGEPHYVTRIEADTRRVVIGRREELARLELFANRANWLIDPPTKPFHALVQIRYNSSAEPALVDPISPDRFHVQFDEPRYGVAPGQAAVCYDGQQVLGGGWIE